MKSARPRLTPALKEQICSYIRSGGFSAIAAEAAGVPREVFERWLRCNRGFRVAVEQAIAHARIAAEARTLSDNPLAWLKHGPGKAEANTPGWSNPPSGVAAPSSQTDQVSDLHALICVVLAALEPFAEARDAVIAALEAHEKKSKSTEPAA